MYYVPLVGFHDQLNNYRLFINFRSRTINTVPQSLAVTKEMWLHSLREILKYKSMPFYCFGGGSPIN